MNGRNMEPSTGSSQSCRGEGYVSKETSGGRDARENISRVILIFITP